MNPAAASPESVGACFHCGEPNPPGARWRLVQNDVTRSFCCGGCLGVTQAIHAAGLDDFYLRRTRPREPHQPRVDSSEGYAAAAQAAGLIISLQGEIREISLLLEGIHCAACVWLNETYLKRQPGVVEVSVNFATRRARIRWDGSQSKLSDLLRAVSAIGYRAYPYDPARREALAGRESRALLVRAALALLAMMQVMMFAAPAYIGSDGVEPEYRTLLEWSSLVLTLPVVLYCATPFFAGALRDLRLGRLGMDVPVTLGVAGAFLASVWATVSHNGAVYYDSVTMFVALLLVARLIELRTRQRAAEAIESIARDLPDTAERLPAYPASFAAETVAATALCTGDCIRVSTGASIPADGEVIEGRSSVEEAVLTGESWPQSKAPGDTVLAGSINRESPLLVRVSAAGEATTLAALGRLVERAASERPRVARIADRIAGGFVGAVLLVALVTGIGWWYLEPARAWAVTFAVLVVSCPCALSLATPAALAAVAGKLGRRRILAVRSDAVETMARVTHVVLDKTGTLTTGRLQLAEVVPLARSDRRACIAIATALEQGSEHPIARALRTGVAPVLPMLAASDVAASPGNGIEGVVEGRRYRLGRPDWVAAMHGMPPAAAAVASDAIAVALGDEAGSVALLSFTDTLRPGARALVARLRETGIEVALLTGDREETARNIAQAVGITDYRGNARPEDKRAHIAEMQRGGAIVAMVGDGVNDAPSLAQANVSLTLGSAATLTQWTADVVVLGDDLPRIAEAIIRARQAFRIIRQNLVWAFGYNLVAIPLAAMGHLTPLAAASGMSVSSLLVVVNALRLMRNGQAAAAVAEAPAGELLPATS